VGGWVTGVLKERLRRFPEHTNSALDKGGLRFEGNKSGFSKVECPLYEESRSLYTMQRANVKGYISHQVQSSKEELPFVRRKIEGQKQLWLC
jgi:hypothetical protein